jgi:F0F1-type ATP synthase membrane subunit b/b'
MKLVNMKYTGLKRYWAGFSVALSVFLLNAATLYAAGGDVQEEPVSGFGKVVEFVRSDPWKTGMEWFNLLVILWLFWRYLLPFLLSGLEDGIHKIEHNLDEVEQTRVKLTDRIETIREQIASVDSVRTQQMEEAKEGASRIRQDILTAAREQELEIFQAVERKAGDYYNERMQDVKNSFYNSAVSSFVGEISGQDSKKKMEQLNHELIARVGGSNEG